MSQSFFGKSLQISGNLSTNLALLALSPLKVLKGT